MGERVGRTPKAKIKSGGLAGVPGGDLFLWEADARFCKGKFAFSGSVSVAWAAPGGSRALAQRPAPGGRGQLSWPGPVNGAGGG